MAKAILFGKKPKRKLGYGYGPWPRPRAETRRPLPHGPTPLRENRQVVEVGPFVVQGQKASDLEARWYRALRRLNWDDAEIDFQFYIHGGRLPGGQIMDFVLTAFGRTTAVAIDGDYWHNRTQQQIDNDKEKQAAFEVYYNRPFKFLKLNSGDLVDDEMAYRRALVEVGRGG